MKSVSLSPWALAAASLLAITLTPAAHAETLDCTPITSLPATISTQGLYCLTGNLTTAQTSGSAIVIAANNVTLDLNGWKVGGQAAGTGTIAYGILSNAVNVTVRNGIVRGFYRGIYLNGRGALVRDMLVDQNTNIGISVGGQGAVVEHNQVIDTGGSTSGASVYAKGIETLGFGTTVTDNMVSGVTATGSSLEYGIYVTNYFSVVRNNVVSDDTQSAAGTSYGIYQTNSSAVNNTVSNFDVGVFSSSGIYAHNTAYNCTTSYAGTGTAGAGNSP